MCFRDYINCETGRRLGADHLTLLIPSLVDLFADFICIHWSKLVYFPDAT